MVVSVKAGLRRVATILVAACAPALAIGYTAFYSIFPSATFPVSGEASFAWILLVLVAAALVGGIQAEKLPDALIAGFVAIALGLALAMVLVASPAFAGLYFTDPSGIPFFVAHYSFLVVALAFPINVVGVIVGQGLREWIRSDSTIDRFR